MFLGHIIFEYSQVHNTDYLKKTINERVLGNVHSAQYFFSVFCVVKEGSKLFNFAFIF